MSACPYCGSKVELIDTAHIYGGRSYGPAWACSRYPECDAYVGCHKGTEKPLGRLANRELREAKKAAHAAFDPLWKGRDKGARSRGYRWIAQQLGIPAPECHIGMMDVERARKVVEACSPFAAPSYREPGGKGEA